MGIRKIRKVLDNTVGNIHPVGDRILVKTEVKSDEFHIPEGLSIMLPPSADPDADRATMRGIVAAIGPGTLRKDGETFDPIDIKVNHRIIMGKYAGTELKQHGVEYRILQTADILGDLGKVTPEEYVVTDPEDGLTDAEIEQGYPDEGQMQDG